MKADLRAELDLLNRNVNEMIRLFQSGTDAGLWTRQEAERHTAHLESLREIECRFQRTRSFA
jgi:tRNA U34 5-carboxymethylaminomethyl modifying enzyme MnmG/GidA